MRARIAIFLAGMCAVALTVSQVATAATSVTAAPVRPGFHVERVCGAPRPGRAACLALKLVRDGTRANAIGPSVAIKAPFPEFLTPRDLHAAYSLPSETAAAAGQTIAVVDAFNDPTAEADLAVYDETFGLPPCTTANGCFRKLNQEGRAHPLPPKEGEWAGEISIDVQMAHAICQNCHIMLVGSNSESWGDLGTAVNAAVAAGATVVSNSYGGPEKRGAIKRGERFFNHPGVVVTASSGDCGYLNEACRGLGKAAEFPAGVAGVIAIGGTSLTSVKKVWTSTTWDEGGSGCSGFFGAPLWQSAVANFAATGCSSGRSVADVSAIGDPNTGVNVYDSTPEGNGNPTGWGVWGGTSVSSPIVAAEFGLGGGARGMAYPASTLYAHAGDPTALYDVISGANGSCAGATICQAAPGYDGPTGVGSPIGLGAFAPAG